MSWGMFVVAGLGIFAITLLLIGLGLIVSDDILDAEDPEDRWDREAHR